MSREPPTLEDFNTNPSFYKKFIEKMEPEVPVMLPEREPGTKITALRTGLYTAATRMGLGGQVKTLVWNGQVWAVWIPEE